MHTRALADWKVTFMNNECSQKLSWVVLHHPLHRPHLVRSDYHLFGPLKIRLHFKPDFETMEATRAYLQEKNTQFFKDVNKLVYWRDICLNV
jgi:hypothetical protein